MTIDYQKLIPDFIHDDIHIETEEDLISFGKGLERVLGWWKWSLEDCEYDIKKTKQGIEQLDGKSITDIQALAENYEDPTFPKVGIPRDSRTKELEPLDEASISRKSGATTFKYCGWCDWCCGGSRRHDYAITTTCFLIPMGLGNGSGLYGPSTCHFNTPCRLTHGTQELLEACLAYSKARLSFLLEKKIEILRNIIIIKQAMKKAGVTPNL